MRLRRRWVHWRREPDGGALVFVGGGFARLNRVAADLWEQIDEGRDRATLLRRMRRRYRGVADARMRADLEGQLDRWLREGWIERQEDPLFPFPDEWWPV